MILTDAQVSRMHQWLGVNAGQMDDDQLLMALFKRAAVLGHEPSLAQRMDKQWQATLHDPNDLDRDADNAIGGDPLSALVRVLLHVWESSRS